MVEELPYDMPVAKGKLVRVSSYFDANHAADKEVCHRDCDVLAVKWYSKQQNTVETSTYGSELVAANCYRVH